MEARERQQLMLSKKWTQYQSVQYCDNRNPFQRSSTQLSSDQGENNHGMRRNPTDVLNLDQIKKVKTPMLQRIDFEIMRRALMSNDLESDDSDSSPVLEGSKTQNNRQKARKFKKSNRFNLMRKRAEINHLQRQKDRYKYMQADEETHRNGTSIIDMTLNCQYYASTGKKMPRSQSTDNILGELLFDIQKEEQEQKILDFEFNELQYDSGKEDNLFELEQFGDAIELNRISPQKQNSKFHQKYNIKKNKLKNSPLQDYAHRQLCVRDDNDNESFFSQSMLSKIEEENGALGFQSITNKNNNGDLVSDYEIQKEIDNLPLQQDGQSFCDDEMINLILEDQISSRQIICTSAQKTRNNTDIQKGTKALHQKRQSLGCELESSLPKSQSDVVQNLSSRQQQDRKQQKSSHKLQHQTSEFLKDKNFENQENNQHRQIQQHKLFRGASTPIEYDAGYFITKQQIKMDKILPNQVTAQ
ncbi:UNKNOWN [Stylonychia lemnae]|uniref:Uncharacterized protein n=1 Tax=Stylonychia lemnae TaxID=5949 RepID=A0A078AP48_STYLE|nr:UNKNOWN [Stylonychia lemnae]|eukprot:CDW83097.1 UNKNOWN [Stylonychia lemnae]